VDSGRPDADQLVMVVLFAASLAGFVLGTLFVLGPRSEDRFTEVYFASYKIPLSAYNGSVDLNYSGVVVHGKLLGHDIWVLGPDTDDEVLVLSSERGLSRLHIYQTFRLGGTYLLFADATSRECLLYEYPREVPENADVRFRFIIENHLGREHTYFYETRLGDEVVDRGQVEVPRDGRVDVISSFTVGSTHNKWTRVSLSLDTGQNISFGFRTYS